MIILTLLLVVGSLIANHLNNIYSTTEITDQSFYQIAIDDVSKIIIISYPSKKNPMVEQMESQLGFSFDDENTIAPQASEKKVILTRTSSTNPTASSVNPSTRFFITSLNDYPANNQAISDIFLQLKSIKIHQEIAKNPTTQQLIALGLDQHSSPELISIQLFDNQDKSLMKLIFGNYYDQNKTKKYIYDLNSDTIYLPTKIIPIPTESSHFLMGLTNFTVPMINSITDYITSKNKLVISKHVVEDNSGDYLPPFSDNSDNYAQSKINPQDIVHSRIQLRLSVFSKQNSLSAQNRYNHQKKPTKKNTTTKADQDSYLIFTTDIDEFFHKDLYQWFTTFTKLPYISFVSINDLFYKKLNFIHSFDIELSSMLIFQFFLAVHSEKTLNLNHSKNKITDTFQSSLLSQHHDDPNIKYYLKINVINSRDHSDKSLTDSYRYLNNWVYQITPTTFGILISGLSDLLIKYR